MSAKLIEPIVDQMKTMLEHNTTGVDARANTIDTEYDDGITLESLQRIYKGGMLVTAELPCLVIWPETPEGTEYTTGTELFTPRVVIWIVCTGTDPENAHQRTWRYQRAVYECISASHNLEGVVDLCNYLGLRFDSPWVFAQEDPLLGVGGVAYEISVEETA